MNAAPRTKALVTNECTQELGYNIESRSQAESRDSPVVLVFFIII